MKRIMTSECCDLEALVLKIYANEPKRIGIHLLGLGFITVTLARNFL